MIAGAPADLRYLDTQHTAVGGTACAGMIVRTATHVIGQLQGFIVDHVTHRLQYLVVKTYGLWGHTNLMPVTAARIDLDARAIELDQDEPQHAFRPELFRAYSEDEQTRF